MTISKKEELDISLEKPILLLIYPSMLINQTNIDFNALSDMTRFALETEESTQNVVKWFEIAIKFRLSLMGKNLHTIWEKHGSIILEMDPLGDMLPIIAVFAECLDEQTICKLFEKLAILEDSDILKKAITGNLKNIWSQEQYDNIFSKAVANRIIGK